MKQHKTLRCYNTLQLTRAPARPDETNSAAYVDSHDPQGLFSHATPRNRQHSNLRAHPKSTFFLKSSFWQRHTSPHIATSRAAEMQVDFLVTFFCVPAAHWWAPESRYARILWGCTRKPARYGLWHACTLSPEAEHWGEFMQIPVATGRGLHGHHRISLTRSTIIVSHQAHHDPFQPVGSQGPCGITVTHHILVITTILTSIHARVWNPMDELWVRAKTL